MKSRRLHILGASGSGTSTLGRALAARLSLEWLDSDDVFWMPTEPPYSTKRPAPERERLLREKLAPASSWVISGSMMGWGDFLRTQFTHVIFLSLPQEERLARLRARERARYGTRLDPGGDMHQMHQEFIAWARSYDEGGREVRSRLLHEVWMRSLPCPVLRVDGLLSTEAQVAYMQSQFDRDFGRVEVSLLEGPAAAPVVEPFYHGLGRAKVVARPGDVFFVARSGAVVLGAVRFCVEEGSTLLRSMLIAEEARKQGVGQKLLAAFDAYVRERAVQTLYCVPHRHLESFYATIGFRALPAEDGPAFLRARVREYHAEGMVDAILMKRGPG